MPFDDVCSLRQELQARLIELETLSEEFLENRETLIECRSELVLADADIQQLVHVISSELKNQLITANGFLMLLEEDLATGDIEAAKQDVATSSAAALKTDQMVEELLTLVRIDRIVESREHVRFGDLVSESLEVMASRIAQRHVEVIVGPDLPVLYGDPPRLREMVLTLVENAVKYTRDRPDPMIEIGSRQEGLDVVCYVRDNGAGIDEVYLERVFGLFHKGGRKDEGIGAGLAVAKRIAQAHRGRIWVESDGPGKGSTFCIMLPMTMQAESDVLRVVRC